MPTSLPAEWQQALAEGRVDLPLCPTCSTPITGWNYDAEILTTADHEPLWPIPGTEREVPVAGPDSYTALPCGHVVDVAVLEFVMRLH